MIHVKVDQEIDTKTKLFSLFNDTLLLEGGNMENWDQLFDLMWLHVSYSQENIHVEYYGNLNQRDRDIFFDVLRNLNHEFPGKFRFS